MKAFLKSFVLGRVQTTCGSWPQAIVWFLFTWGLLTWFLWTMTGRLLELYGLSSEYVSLTPLATLIPAWRCLPHADEFKTPAFKEADDDSHA